MTGRLYQDSPYLLEFKSRIREAKETGDGLEVILEESAFYPDSGGQLCDRGSINGNQVLRVFENDQGEIVHLLISGNLSIGTEAVGKIDRDWRLDNMRKHTGQHILSRAFIEIAEAETLSSRLGEVESTIELSRETLDEGVIKAVEQLANGVVRGDQQVRIAYFSREELRNIPIRKIPERDGKYRIIQIGEFDYTACGGTHCTHTGEIGLIKIIGQEKLRGHLRVIFVTGRQAEEDYYQKHKVVGYLSGKLTCHFMDLGHAVDKLVEQGSSLRRENAEISSRLLDLEMRKKLKEEPDSEGIKIISGDYDEYDGKVLKETVQRLAGEIKAIFLLYSGDKLLLALSPGLKWDAVTLAREFMRKFGGKGGGSPLWAQVGGLSHEGREKNLRSFVEMVRNGLID